MLIILLLATDEDNEDARIIRDVWLEFVEKRTNCALIVVWLIDDDNTLRPGQERGEPQPSLERESAGGRVVTLRRNDLGERDIQHDLLRVHVLNQSLRLLNRVRFPDRSDNDKATLFISHAKRDGVPLARSIRYWLDWALEGFQFFYDTDHLDLTEKKGTLSYQLETAVSGSVLIALRTEAYDQRYWCQKEMYWAESHGVPILAVDSRWGLQHPPSVVTFDSSPSIRIPDGSVIRILLAALTESLRLCLFQMRVSLTAQHASGGSLGESDWKSLPRYPSLGSLRDATEPQPPGSSLPDPFYIVYPNPTLPDVLRDVAFDMAEARHPGARVVSLDEFRIATAP